RGRGRGRARRIAPPIHPGPRPAQQTPRSRGLEGRRIANVPRPYTNPLADHQNRPGGLAGGLFGKWSKTALDAGKWPPPKTAKTVPNTTLVPKYGQAGTRGQDTRAFLFSFSIH